MAHPIPLYLPSDAFHALTKHTGEGWFGPKTEAALCKLIRDWIANTAATPDILDEAPNLTPGVAHDSGKGYQWKQLFLPNGTELRSTFCGKSTYAKVQDESIICDDAPTMPSRLANASGCGTRNAWQNIWLKFPGDSTWKLARKCRPPA